MTPCSLCVCVCANGQVRPGQQNLIMLHTWWELLNGQSLASSMALVGVLELGWFPIQPPHEHGVPFPSLIQTLIPSRRK